MREPKDATILVVDDEPALRKAIIYDLKKKGFNVLDAENGTKAFEIVKNSKIDLVLTDVRMPGGDGVELLDRIKALNPKLPVVMFITGFADISVEEAYNKGVDAVFSKPFDRKALFAAVIKAIAEKDEQGSRKSNRLDANFDIEMSLADLNMTTHGKILNISRSGIFVALNGNFPSVGSKVNFNIRFHNGSQKNIAGSGLIRWVRAQASDTIPAGCGLEFDYLDDLGRKQIIELINLLKTKSFGPKS